MNYLTELIRQAINARSELLQKLEAEETDTYRLFHGVNEGRPGLTIDRYGAQVLIQTFNEPVKKEDIKAIQALLNDIIESRSHVVYNHRQGNRIKNIPVRNVQLKIAGTIEPVCKEMGVQYRVKDESGAGLDPLLFIDLRAARRFLMKQARDKTVLNLFAYTCGVGVAAGVAGAKHVLNVDFSQSNLLYGKENAGLNAIETSRIEFMQQDVIPVIRQFAGLGVKGKGRLRQFKKLEPQQFDIVFLDPPTWAKSAFGAVDLVRDYQGLFKPALLCVKQGGMMICTNHVASVAMETWLEQLKRCAQKAGREIKDIHVIEPEPDFPSPDRKFPLKIAVCNI